MGKEAKSQVKECIIISGSPEWDVPLNMKYENYYIYAADGGAELALKHGIKIDMAVGDFDTYKGRIPNDVEIKKFPSEKDNSDTLECLIDAKNKGFNKAIIINALGGARIDHSIANIQILEWASVNGIDAHIEGKNSEVYFQSEKLRLYPKKKFKYLSVFAYSEKCTGVCICGTKYEIENTQLNRFYPIGLSNEITEEYAEIKLESGKLLIIYSNDRV